MERLTEYDEFGNAEFVGIDNTKLYERLVCDETVALTMATNKLGKLEDVMEKYGIENLEEYISALNEDSIRDNMRYIEELAEKEKELKQQLHDLPKKIVGEIKDKIPEIGGMKCEIIIDDSLTLNTLLDTILKKYGGEDE